MPPSTVLSRGGKAVDLSNDHKPFLTDEKTRIEHAGGHVKFNRVNGDLAVSRALGDFAYKMVPMQREGKQRNGGLHTRAARSPPAPTSLRAQRPELSPEQQQVTALPEIIPEARDPADDFIVLACDGIWDVMTSQECVSLVHDLLRADAAPDKVEKPGGAADMDPAASNNAGTPSGAAPTPRPWDLGSVCEVVLDKCLDKGSRDNMSVVIAVLRPELVPEVRRGGGPAAPPPPVPPPPQNHVGPGSGAATAPAPAGDEEVEEVDMPPPRLLPGAKQ